MNNHEDSPGKRRHEHRVLTYIDGRLCFFFLIIIAAFLIVIAPLGIMAMTGLVCHLRLFPQVSPTESCR
jgi:hypothetical protein